jgi:hypothetical protein
MSDTIRIYLPWLLSAITIWMTLLAGNLHRNAWLVGLGNQLLWLIWIVVAGTWGLIPLNIALWVVYARNHWKWSRPAAEISDPEAWMREDGSAATINPLTAAGWKAQGHEIVPLYASDVGIVGRQKT